MKKVQKIYKFDDLPDILTLEEAGMLIRSNPDTLRKKASKGQFPAYRLNPEAKRSQWRIDKNQLKKWLDEKQAAVV
ncbi:MAG: hypothetical protein ACI4W6_04160 [Acutalibacteraceae bacterium]